MDRSDRVPPTRSSARYTASFFGAFRVTIDNQVIGDQTRRNRSILLLKWFLLNPGRQIGTDELCALFWPGRRKESAVNNLQVSLNHLRRVLEPRIRTRGSSTFIRRSGRYNYYRFDHRDLWWPDAWDVRDLSVAARNADRHGEQNSALSLYEQVADYYRLSFLPEDVYEDIFAPYRQEHDLANVQCLNRLMQLRLQTSQLPKALFCATELLRIDPYSRDAVKTIVEVRAQQGDIAGAVRQLDDFFHTLECDMGIAPGKELINLRNSL
jgi:DNA-binding SARP family transcriptional activator